MTHWQEGISIPQSENYFLLGNDSDCDASAPYVQATENSLQLGPGIDSELPATASQSIAREVPVHMPQELLIQQLTPRPRSEGAHYGRRTEYAVRVSRQTSLSSAKEAIEVQSCCVSQSAAVGVSDTQTIEITEATIASVPEQSILPADSESEAAATKTLECIAEAIDGGCLATKVCYVLDSLIN